MKPEADSRPPSLARDATTITVLTFISRLTGLVRIAVVSAVLGATVLADVYQGSNTVPNVVFELLAGGTIQAVLVPLFVRSHSRSKSTKDATTDDDTGTVLGTAIALMTVCAIVLAALAPLLARLLGVAGGDAGLSKARVETATLFLLVFSPQIIFYAIGGISTAALNARGRFAVAAIAPALNNIVVIGVYLIFDRMINGVPTLDVTFGEKLFLAAGTTLGVVVFTTLPLITLARTQQIKLRVNLRNQSVLHIRGIGKWAALQIIASVVPIGAAVIVGAHSTGGVAVFSYSYAIFLLPFALIASPIATALVPRIAAAHQANDSDTARKVFLGALTPALLLLIFAAVNLGVLAQPISRLVSFGELAGADRELFARSLAWIAFGIVGYGLWFMYTRALFAVELIRLAALTSTALAMVCVMTMVGGTRLFPEVNSAVIMSVAISLSYLIGAVALVFVAPRTFRPTRANISRDLVVGVSTSIGVYLLMSLWLNNAWVVTSRFEAGLKIATIVLAALPVALVVGVMSWRNTGNGVFNGQKNSRVIQVIGPSTGGIRRHAVSLREYLIGLGVNVEIWAPLEVVGFASRQESPVPAYELPIPSGWNPFALVRATIKFRSRVVGDEVFHCHGLRAALVVSFAGARPRIVTWHNQVLTEVHGTKAHILSRVERILMKRADHVLATTVEMRRDLLSYGISSDHLSLVRPAHVVATPQRSHEQIRTHTDALGKSLIVCVARLNRQKGIDIFLDAVARVVADQNVDRSELRVVIVGDGPDAQSLLTRSADSELQDIVRFVGADDDAVSYIRAADLVCIPSRWESGPLVALEAMAFGRPIVATATGFIPELLGRGIITIVTPGDVKALAGAIAEALVCSPTIPQDQNITDDLLKSEFVSTAQTIISIYRQFGLVTDGKRVERT